MYSLLLTLCVRLWRPGPHVAPYAERKGYSGGQTSYAEREEYERLLHTVAQYVAQRWKIGNPAGGKR
jgi:hypothetical protein